MTGSIIRRKSQGRPEISNRGKGVDCVYDAIGGAFSEPALRAMAWKGRFLVVGFASGEIPKIPLNLTLLKGCAILGVYWGEFVKREPEAHRTNMARIFDWAAKGVFRLMWIRCCRSVTSPRP